MKIINFSCKEILPSLLDKTKTQTIRKAWERLVHTPDYRERIKPPEYKVGDKVQLIWKKESKYEWFCRDCKLEMKRVSERDFICCPKCDNQISGEVFHNIEEKKDLNIFNKLLGTVEITEVFTLELHYKPCKLGKLCVINLKDSLFSDRAKIAKLDGFKDTVEMFKVLDKMYDLSTPKKFFVYRWKWSETN